MTASKRFLSLWYTYPSGPQVQRKDCDLDVRWKSNQRLLKLGSALGIQWSADRDFKVAVSYYHTSVQ